MPITTFTGLSAATHYVSQEEISSFLDGYNYPPPVPVVIAAAKEGKGTVPVRFPRLGAISVPAGTLAETVDAVDVNVSTAENSLTPARVAFAMPISDFLQMNQVGTAVPGAILADAVRASWARIASDLNAGSTSATNSTGAVGDICTRSSIRAMKAVWRALNVDPGALGVALVLHGGALSALEEDVETAGSVWALRPGDNPSFSLMHGYQGRYKEFELFSDNQVAAESTGRSNYVTPIGAGSGLGLVMVKEPSITLHRGNDGLRRAAVFAHIEMYFAGGIVNSDEFLEFLTDD